MSAGGNVENVFRVSASSIRMSTFEILCRDEVGLVAGLRRQPDLSNWSGREAPPLLEGFVEAFRQARISGTASVMVDGGREKATVTVETESLF